MGVIWLLSAQPGLSTGLGVWDLLLRKLGHMAVFGALWWLWWRALGRGAIWPAAALAVAYAAVDEWHQHFVPDRHGSAFDVMIDAAGVAVAIALAVRPRSV